MHAVVALGPSGPVDPGLLDAATRCLVADLDAWLAELQGCGDHGTPAAQWAATGTDRLSDLRHAVAPPTTRSWRVRVEPASAASDEAAARAGFHPVRTLEQLRCPLDDATVTRWRPPGDEPEGAAPRPFTPGRDEAAWLAVNNAAFAWHPEQGGWTVERLQAELDAEGFDPHDLLVLDGSGGTMIGFCWTKLHAEEVPPIGEIYVIGVHPDHHGRGIGRQLVIAGLRHLRHLGAPIGMLWVEADNRAAQSLYRSLGFLPHHRTTFYEAAPGDDPGDDPSGHPGSAS